MSNERMEGKYLVCHSMAHNSWCVYYAKEEYVHEFIAGGYKTVEDAKIARDSIEYARNKNSRA